MLITVQREAGDAQCTPGRMLLDGVPECFTLEPRRDQSQGKPYCVPAGLYSYSIYSSPHFGRNVIAVESIPGFTDVEVHPGNFPSDTHGCCLVGKTEGTDFIGQSDAEFDVLMGKVPPVGQIQYLDPPAPATVIPPPAGTSASTDSE
jgi:Family of unknown function (DUF5675)